MKKIFISMVILISFLLSGCYDYRELNTLAIVSGLAIDKENEDFVITVQVIGINPLRQEEGKQIKPIIYEGRGKTIFAALRRMTLESPRRLFLNHLEIIIIQEKIAHHGVKNTIDFILRDYETTKQFPVLIAKEETAAEILKIYSPIETLTSRNISNSIDTNSKYDGIANKINYDEFISLLMKQGIQPILNGIEIKGKEKQGTEEKSITTMKPEASLKITSLSVFKEDKLIGWLNMDETLGFNFANNRINSAVINIPCKHHNDYLAVEIISSKATIKPTIKNNKPHITINIQTVGGIDEVNCPIKLEDNKVIEQIKKDVNKEITNLVNKATTAAQRKYATDIFGFGYHIYLSNPQYWQKNKQKWDDIYPTIDCKIKVETKIFTRGLLIKTIK